MALSTTEPGTIRRLSYVTCWIIHWLYKTGCVNPHAEYVTFKSVHIYIYIYIYEKGRIDKAVSMYDCIRCISEQAGVAVKLLAYRLQCLMKNFPQFSSVPAGTHRKICQSRQWILPLKRLLIHYSVVTTSFDATWSENSVPQNALSPQQYQFRIKCSFKI